MSARVCVCRSFVSCYGTSIYGTRFVGVCVCFRVRSDPANIIIIDIDNRKKHSHTLTQADDESVIPHFSHFSQLPVVAPSSQSATLPRTHTLWHPFFLKREFVLWTGNQNPGPDRPPSRASRANPWLVCVCALVCAFMEWN